MSARGPHPDDARLFAPAAVPTLQRAAHEVNWLLGRGYSMLAAVRAAGDHHQLDARQRTALTRTCCADPVLAARLARRRELASLERGSVLHIDGFNLIVTLEVSLGGGVLLRGRDHALRDLAGMRGSYHVIDATRDAVAHLAETLRAHGDVASRWYFDAPVSNSGRLRALVDEALTEAGLSVATELVPDADTALRGLSHVVSADGVVLDHAASWVDLASMVVARHAPGAWIVPIEP